MTKKGRSRRVDQSAQAIKQPEPRNDSDGKKKKLYLLFIGVVFQTILPFAGVTSLPFSLFIFGVFVLYFCDQWPKKVIVTWLVTFIGICPVFISGWLFKKDNLLKMAESKYNDWTREFEPNLSLFRVLPLDVDFMIRDLWLSRRTGKSVKFTGTGANDSLRIVISQFRTSADGSNWALLAIDGEIGTNYVRKSSEIELSRGSTQWLQIYPSEFLLYVEDVTIDSFNLCVARRFVDRKSRVEIKNSDLGIIRIEVPRSEGIFDK